VGLTGRTRKPRRAALADACRARWREAAEADAGKPAGVARRSLEPASSAQRVQVDLAELSKQRRIAKLADCRITRAREGDSAGMPERKIVRAAAAGLAA
jgi:transposase-like protein